MGAQKKILFQFFFDTIITGGGMLFQKFWRERKDKIGKKKIIG